VPRSSALGALLLTGYLGGAVATHLRVGSPLTTHVLFPVYVGVIIWAGLILRRADLRHALLDSWPRPISTAGRTTPEPVHPA
jgi:DoxX-like family